jgi:hypothetical protein
VTIPVPDVRRLPAHPRAVIDSRPLDARTSRRWTTVLDLVAVIVATVVVLSIVAGHVGPLRSIAALVFALLVPGWAICRWCGWTFSAATLLTAGAVSVATMIVVGQIAVTRSDHDLENVSAVLAAVCLGALGLMRVVRGSGG